MVTDFRNSKKHLYMQLDFLLKWLKAKEEKEKEERKKPKEKKAGGV